MTELKAEIKPEVPAAKKVDEPVIGDQGTAPPALTPITNRADHNAALAATRGIKAPELPTISVLPADVPAQFADQAHSLADRTAFANTMNRDADVQAVFAPRPRGGTDYFEKIDGKDDPGFFYDGTDGKITRAGMQAYLDENDHPGRQQTQQKAVIAGLHKLLDNWDNPDMAQYKTEDGSGITRDSFKAGMAREDKLVADSTTKLAQDIETSKKPGDQQSEIKPAAPDKPTEGEPNLFPDKRNEIPTLPNQFPDQRNDIPPASGATLNDGVDKLALVKKGEGPYQVAARILSIDGQKHDHKEVMAFTRALQAQYREEHKDDISMNGLRVHHALLSPANAEKVLANISNPALREKIRKEVLKAS